MSNYRQFILNSACTVAIGVVFGYGVIYSFHQSQAEVQQITGHTRSTSRGIASLGAPVVVHDESHFGIFKMSQHEKLFDYLEVKIQHIEIAQSADDFSKVIAMIKAKKDLPPNLKYQWKLARDMRSDDLSSGFIPALKAGDIKEIELNVRGFSKEFQTYLGLVVSGFVEGESLSREYLSSSRPEDSFEYVVQQRNLNERRELEKKNGSSNKMGEKPQQTFLERKFSTQNLIK